ncbi:MAG: metalloregulator ArsR/SmtB family transcription factor [Nitrospirota bacterium]
MSDPDECTVPCYKATAVARLKEQMPPEEELQRLAELFGLLADRTRLCIISALASGEELCVCDVSHVLGLSLSATSHQLRKLRDAGVVAYRNDGRMAYYRLRDGFLAGLMAQGRLQLERPVL